MLVGAGADLENDVRVCVLGLVSDGPVIDKRG